MGRVKTLQASTGTSAGTVTGIDGSATAKSADYIVTDTDNVRTVLMTTGASARTVTLPTAADNTHRTLTIKKVDSGAGTCIIDGEGSETIDGSTTLTLTAQQDAVTLQCDGTTWHTVARAFLDTVSVTSSSLFTQATPTTGTWYDVSSMALAALTPGVWMIHFHGAPAPEFSVSGETYGRIALREGSNVISQLMGPYQKLANSGISQSLSGTVPVTIAAGTTKTYKLSVGVVTASGSPTYSNVYCRGDHAPSYIYAVRR